jgi:hypothetical protein
VQGNTDGSGASVLPKSTRKKSNGKKEATRIKPGEAVFAYHRDKQQQEEDEKNERERKKARKRKSSSSTDARNKEAHIPANSTLAGWMALIVTRELARLRTRARKSCDNSCRPKQKTN